MSRARLLCLDDQAVPEDIPARQHIPAVDVGAWDQAPRLMVCSKGIQQRPSRHDSDRHRNRGVGPCCFRRRPAAADPARKARPATAVTAALVAGLLAGYGIAIPVGAVGAYLVALTARTSLRVGVAAALGVATVDGGYALLAMFGGGTLIRVITPVTDVLRWIATGVLIAVAVQITRSAIRRYRTSAASPPQHVPQGATSPARAYAALVAMTLLNPTTIIYFVAVVLGGQVNIADTGRERSAFVVAAFIASASWQLLLAGGGALLGRTLTGRRGQLCTALASSAVIAVLAVQTAWN